MFRIILGLLAAALLSHCTYEAEPPTECAALSISAVSYIRNVYPIIGTSCALPDCHNHGFENGDFNDFPVVQEKARSGKLVFMIEQREMPHGFTNGPTYLTSCEIEIIKKWVNEGANNN